jgi:hypothetical protein
VVFALSLKGFINLSGKKITVPETRQDLPFFELFFNFFNPLQCFA